MNAVVPDLPPIDTSRTPRVVYLPDHQLVEKRVRRSLARVKTVETTPQESLKSVVEQLRKELNDHEFDLLIEYFQTKGPLSGAKQLLLESLSAARQETPSRSCRTAAHTQQQNFSSSTHSATTAVEPSCWHTPPPQLPLIQQQQRQYPAGRKAAAAGAASDTTPCSDQGYPLSFTQLLLQQQQQQQQRKHPPQAHTDSTAAAAGSSKWRAFAVSQGLGPLQL